MFVNFDKLLTLSRNSINMEHKLILLCYALFAVSTVYAQAAAFSAQEQSDLLLCTTLTAETFNHQLQLL
jgi:hypothetical protein